MIDIHCHILPGIDDGAVSIEESVQMAKTAVLDGIQTIIATPHTLDGVHKNPVSKVCACVDNLKRALSEADLNISIYPGADVHLCPDIVKKINSGHAGTINNKMKFILLELPSQTLPSGIKDEIFSLKINGLTPIITHPERNAVFQKNRSILHDLIHMGAISQITAMSITGDFGPYIKSFAEYLLKHRLVHMIASDAHSQDTRPPILSKAVEMAANILGSQDALKMVTDIPNAVLLGEMPEIPDPMK